MLSDEELEGEFYILEKLAGINNNSGQLVETKSGVIGRTYSNEEPINGKIRVYTEGGNLLCKPENLTLKGYID